MNLSRILGVISLLIFVSIWIVGQFYLPPGYRTLLLMDGVGFQKQLYLATAGLAVGIIGAIAGKVRGEKKTLSIAGGVLNGLFLVAPVIFAVLLVSH